MTSALVYRRFVAYDDASKGGADFSLVEVESRQFSWTITEPHLAKQRITRTWPRCKKHGAMNKVSEHGLWRCIATSGAKSNGCRAACQEEPQWVTAA